MSDTATQTSQVAVVPAPVVATTTGAAPEQAGNSPPAAPPAAAPATDKPAAPPPDPFARKFAALSRKDQEVRERAEEVKTLQKQNADLKAQLERATKPSVPDPALPVEQKLEILEKKIDAQEQERERRALAAEAEAEKRALDVWRKEVAQKIAASSEHEFAKVEDGAIDDVIRVMTEHWNEHQEIMDYKDALDTVETFYEKKFEQRAALAKAKKLVGVAPPPQEAPQVSIVTPSTAAPQVMTPAKTLTGSMTSQTPAKSPDTAADRLARAIHIVKAAHPGAR